MKTSNLKKSSVAGMSKIEEYAVVAPDGGWGWVVVAAAFYCNTVIDGTIFTFGMYLDEIRKHYEVSSTEVATISSLMFGFHLAAGPFCSAMTKSFGFRPTVVIASFITAASLASAYLEPPFWLLTIMLGVIAGSASCFVYMNSISVTSTYFSKYKFLAVGITVCGTGAGTVIFAQASNEMLKRFTWGEAHLILAGSTLLMAVAGLTFRPLRPTALASSTSMPIERITSIDVDRISYQSEKEVFLLSRQKAGSAVSVKDATNVAFETFTSQFSDRRPDALDKICAKMCHCCWNSTTEVIVMNPLTKKELIDGKRENGNIKAIRMEPQTGTHWQRMKTAFTHMDWNILKEPSFVLYCVSGSLTTSAIIIFFFFEAATLMSLGCNSDQATSLISTIGGANMFWRICLGLIATIPRVNYLALMIVCHVLGGISVCTYIINPSLPIQYLICVIFSIGLAGFAVFRPVLLLEIVGRERLTNATGIYFFISGIASILGPPLAGILMHWMGKSNYLNPLIGALFIISGIMLIFNTGRSPLIYVPVKEIIPGSSTTS